MRRASVMLMLALLPASAAGTQLVAPFTDGSLIAPLMIVMLVPLLVILPLVAPYSKAVVAVEPII